MSSRDGSTLELLARRGALDVFDALVGGPLAERALTRRLHTLAPSVVTQRVADLRRLGVLERVPESGDLRISPSGRRLQGVLAALHRWEETDRGVP